jgi:hypothetical protein
MSKDALRVWNPISDLPTRLYVEAVHDDYEGFRILLRGEKASDRMLRVSFEMPLLYRKTDEGDRLRTIQNDARIKEAVFFIVECSSLVEWLSTESYEVRDVNAMKHFLFACSNDLIDVVAESEPKFDWL